MPLLPGQDEDDAGTDSPAIPAIMANGLEVSGQTVRHQAGGKQGQRPQQTALRQYPEPAQSSSTQRRVQAALSWAYTYSCTQAARKVKRLHCLHAGRNWG